MDGRRFTETIVFGLVLALIPFLIFWLTGWAPIGTAGLMAALVALVVVGFAAYRSFVAPVDLDRPGPSLLLSALLLVALALPLWGTEKFWILLIGGLVTAPVRFLLQRRGARR